MTTREPMPPDQAERRQRGAPPGTGRALSFMAVIVFLGLWGMGLIPSACDAWFLPSLAVLAVILVCAGRAAHLRAVGRLMLLFAATGLTLLVLDAALRLVGQRLVYYRPEDQFFTTRVQMPLVYFYKPDVSFAGETYGDMAALSPEKSLRDPRHIVFRTDAHGFRNRAHAADEVCDVVVLGDSFGAGTGSSQDETWTSVLEARYGLSVYNLSVQGSPWQSLMNLRSEMPRLRIRSGGTVLLAIFTGNDLDDLYGPDAAISGASWRAALDSLRIVVRVFRNRSPVRQMVQQYRLRRARSAARGAAGVGPGVMVREFPPGKSFLFYAPYAEAAVRTPAEVVRHAHWEYLRHTLVRINELCRERGLVFKVALIPAKSEVYAWVVQGAAPWTSSRAPSGFSETLAGFCAQQRMDFLDLKPALIEASREAFEESGSLLWWLDDTHWNPAGQAAAAKAIHDQLLRPPAD